MQFGRYHLEDTLKQRGPVVTRRARDAGDGAPVILKMLKPEAISPEAVAALRREYALISDISSPRVVRAIDLVWSGDCPALVLQDMQGEVLAGRLTGAALPMDDALAIAIGAAEALDAVHEAGIMHGDINPWNLLVGAEPGDVGLIDFGFSERGGLPPREGAGLRGSPNYIAPELTGRLAQGADHRADLYSLGVLLYQMLTGALPFATSDLLGTVYAHMALQPRPLRDLAPTVPQVLADLVSRLMAKRPEERYQTASGLAADLRHCRALIAGQHDEGAAFDLGREDVPRRLSVSTSLQGRAAEVEALRQAFDAVRAGAPAGLSVEVSGAAGMGKTTLVHALLPYFDADAGLFVTGRVDAGSWDDPLGGLVEAARRLCELLLTERYGALDTWRLRLREGMGDLLAVMAHWVPEIRALAGEAGAAAPLEPRETAERLGQAFRRFFRVCATPEHPLILVLEDVHAADPATLSLLDGLARPEGPEHLLLILTRRAAAGETAAPPAPRVDRRIALADLGPDAAAQMLAETFRTEAAGCRDLAEAILSKVAGAPLAIGQFLGALVDDGAVRFDPEANAWRWDIDAVRARDAGDDVADILLARGARLTAEERATLGAVACAGRSFTRDEAEAAAGALPETVAAHLERAVAMGWIAPDFDLRAHDSEPGLRFLHDRVLEAARTLVDGDAARRRVHARLADFHLAAADGAPEGERLFTVARHLGHACAPEADAGARAQARGLNAAAGGAAIALGDLRRSHAHFDTAADLIAGDDIAQDPEGMLGIVAAAAGAALLAGDIAAMERRRDTFLAHCPDPAGRAKIRTLDLFAALGANRALDALAIGRAALAELGDPLPDAAGQAEIGAEVGGFFAALAGRSIETIPDLPEVADPVHAATHDVLAAMLFPAYSTDPGMFAVIAARLSARALVQGFSPSALEGFNGVGIMACGPMNQVDLGYGIASVCQHLARDRALNGARARVETIHNAFIRHRKEPIRDTLDGLTTAREIALTCGDIQSAALASYDHAFQVFWIGERLEAAEEAMAESWDFVADLKTGIYPELIRIYRETLAALRDGPADPARLSGAFADGADLLDHYRARRNPNGLSQLHLAQMLQAHVFRDRATALAEGRAAMQVLDGITSTPAVPAAHALFAMIATPAAEGAAPDPQDADTLAAGRALTELWAGHAPRNYRHFALVCTAEAALAQGDETAWLEALERAADHATTEGFTRDAALILERIATVSQARGRARRFTHFLRDAWRAWVHYGADAKVAALSEAHRGILGAVTSADDESEAMSLSLSVNDENLDLGALLKATRAISQGMHLSDLLRALLAGIVETAGADNALVLAPDGKQFRVIAKLSAGADGPVYESEPDIASGQVCDAATAPLSALRLVAQLRAPLSTGDVAGDARLSGDPYLRASAPKSLAIVPMLNGARLLGLVYLENRQIEEAFSPMRMNLLGALSAQAAVSWDNASLYERQARLLEAADRFVPAELSRLFNRDSIADVRLTDARAGRMTLMVSDLRNSTSQAERAGPKQTFAQINAFLSGFSRTVRAHGGFVLKYVGDGVLAVFPGGPSGAMDAATAYQHELHARDWDPTAGGPLSVGIAIHSGDVMFGVVGDETRMQIDALSDAVNVTFRLESMTKRLGAKVLVSDAALRELGPAEATRHRCRFLGEVETEGRRGLEGVHELLDAEPVQVRDARLATLALFEEGVRRFAQRDFVNACVHLGSVLRDSPADAAASRLFQEAAQRMGQSAAE